MRYFLLVCENDVTDSEIDAAMLAAQIPCNRLNCELTSFQPEGFVPHNEGQVEVKITGVNNNEQD